MVKAPPEKKRLIWIALISILMDSGLSFFEVPFFGALPLAVTIEEILELLISTFLARDRIKLDWLDRVLGFLPIPGITAITVRLIRDFFKKK